MKLFEFDNVEKFYEAVSPILLQDEVINNLSLGILYALQSKSKDVNFNETPFLGLVGDENKPELILIMTPPQNLIVCGTDNNLDITIPIAVDYMIAHNVFIPGVIGVNRLAETFKDDYVAKMNLQVKRDMAQRIYKLEKVEPVPISPGHLRIATLDDTEMITEWILAFDKESMNGDMTEIYARERAQRGVTFQTIHIWEDGGRPVSMANMGRKTQKGLIVNLVYTPKKLRGKGYATSCVAKLSQKALDEGKEFCSLYTDLSNPTSNSIYQKIGYKPISDSVVYKFLK